MAEENLLNFITKKKVAIFYPKTYLIIFFYHSLSLIIINYLSPLHMYPYGPKNKIKKMEKSFFLTK